MDFNACFLSRRIFDPIKRACRGYDSGLRMKKFFNTYSSHRTSFSHLFINPTVKPNMKIDKCMYAPRPKMHLKKMIVTPDLLIRVLRSCYQNLFLFTIQNFLNSPSTHEFSPHQRWHELRFEFCLKLGFKVGRELRFGDKVRKSLSSRFYSYEYMKALLLLPMNMGRDLRMNLDTNPNMNLESNLNMSLNMNKNLNLEINLNTTPAMIQL